MPDAWEIAHGLNPDDPGDADLDEDGDRSSNLHEYLAGTDALDPADNLHITALIVSNNAVCIRFTATSNRNYEIQRGALPALLEATSVTNNLHSFGNSEQELIIPGAAGGATNCFYRIRLQQ